MGLEIADSDHCSVKTERLADLSAWTRSRVMPGLSIAPELLGAMSNSQDCEQMAKKHLLRRGGKWTEPGLFEILVSAAA